MGGVTVIKRDWYRDNVVWTSFFGLVLILLRSTGLLQQYGLDESRINDFIDLIMTILVGRGIVHSTGSQNN